MSAGQRFSHGVTIGLNHRHIYYTCSTDRENTTISFQQARPVKRLHGGGNEMFGQSDEEEQRDDQGERRKRLFRFDDESEKKRQLADQKKASVRKLIDSIPTKKEELFEYSISWDSLDKVRCMSHRIPKARLVCVFCGRL